MANLIEVDRFFQQYNKEPTGDDKLFSFLCQLLSTIQYEQKKRGNKDYFQNYSSSIELGRSLANVVFRILPEMNRNEIKKEIINIVFEMYPSLPDLTIQTVSTIIYQKASEKPELITFFANRDLNLYDVFLNLIVSYTRRLDEGKISSENGMEELQTFHSIVLVIGILTEFRKNRRNCFHLGYLSIIIKSLLSLNTYINKSQEAANLPIREFHLSKSTPLTAFAVTVIEQILIIYKHLTYEEGICDEILSHPDHFTVILLFYEKFFYCGNIMQLLSSILWNLSFHQDFLQNVIFTYDLNSPAESLSSRLSPIDFKNHEQQQANSDLDGLTLCDLLIKALQYYTSVNLSSSSSALVEMSGEGINTTIVKEIMGVIANFSFHDYNKIKFTINEQFLQLFIALSAPSSFPSSTSTLLSFPLGHPVTTVTTTTATALSGNTPPATASFHKNTEIMKLFLITISNLSVNSYNKRLFSNYPQLFSNIQALFLYHYDKKHFELIRFIALVIKNLTNNNYLNQRHFSQLEMNKYLIKFLKYFYKQPLISSKLSPPPIHPPVPAAHSISSSSVTSTNSSDTHHKPPPVPVTATSNNSNININNAVSFETVIEVLDALNNLTTIFEEEELEELERQDKQQQPSGGGGHPSPEGKQSTMTLSTSSSMHPSHHLQSEKDSQHNLLIHHHQHQRHHYLFYPHHDFPSFHVLLHLLHQQSHPAGLTSFVRPTTTAKTSTTAADYSLSSKTFLASSHQQYSSNASERLYHAQTSLSKKIHKPPNADDRDNDEDDDEDLTDPSVPFDSGVEGTAAASSSSSSESMGFISSTDLQEEEKRKEFFNYLIEENNNIQHCHEQTTILLILDALQYYFHEYILYEEQLKDLEIKIGKEKKRKSINSDEEYLGADAFEKRIEEERKEMMSIEFIHEKIEKILLFLLKWIQNLTLSNEIREKFSNSFLLTILMEMLEFFVNLSPPLHPVTLGGAGHGSVKLTGPPPPASSQVAGMSSTSLMFIQQICKNLKNLLSVPSSFSQSTTTFSGEVNNDLELLAPEKEKFLSLLARSLVKYVDNQENVLYYLLIVVHTLVSRMFQFYDELLVAFLTTDVCEVLVAIVANHLSHESVAHECLQILIYLLSAYYQHLQVVAAPSKHHRRHPHHDHSHLLLPDSDKLSEKPATTAVDPSETESTATRRNFPLSTELGKAGLCEVLCTAIMKFQPKSPVPATGVIPPIHFGSASSRGLSTIKKSNREQNGDENDGGDEVANYLRRKYHDQIMQDICYTIFLLTKDITPLSSNYLNARNNYQFYELNISEILLNLFSIYHSHVDLLPFLCLMVEGLSNLTEHAMKFIETSNLLELLIQLWTNYFSNIDFCLILCDCFHLLLSHAKISISSTKDPQEERWMSPLSLLTVRPNEFAVARFGALGGCTLLMTVYTTYLHAAKIRPYDSDHHEILFHLLSLLHLLSAYSFTNIKIFSSAGVCELSMQIFDLYSTNSKLVYFNTIIIHSFLGFSDNLLRFYECNLAEMIVSLWRWYQLNHEVILLQLAGILYQITSATVMSVPKYPTSPHHFKPPILTLLQRLGANSNNNNSSGSAGNGNSLESSKTSSLRQYLTDEMNNPKIGTAISQESNSHPHSTNTSSSSSNNNGNGNGSEPEKKKLRKNEVQYEFCQKLGELGICELLHSTLTRYIRHPELTKLQVAAIQNLSVMEDNRAKFEELGSLEMIRNLSSQSSACIIQ